MAKWPNIKAERSAPPKPYPLHMTHAALIRSGVLLAITVELISTSLVVSGASLWRRRLRDSKQSAFLKSNLMRAKSSKKTGLTCRTTATSEICAASAQTLSLAGFHASPTLQAGSAEARAMTAHSGRKCSASYASQSRLGCWVKMCLESSAWNSTKSVLTWKRKATKSNRCLFQLSPQMRPTSGCAAGYWPTFAPGTHGRGWSPLRAQVNAMNRGEKPKCQVLTVDMVMLAEMQETGRTFDEVKSQSGSLNPEWVEWLMGYPIGHTDCGDSATPSCRKSPPKSSKT